MGVEPPAQQQRGGRPHKNKPAANANNLFQALIERLHLLVTTT